MKFQTFSIVTGTMACDARCPYCISGLTSQQGLTFKKPIVNWRNFDIACRLAEKAGVMTAMLTGKGEPTLFPDMITEYLEAIQLKYNFPIIEIQSNGLNAGRDKLDDYLKRWYDLGLSTFAISVASHKEEHNRQVYTPKGQYINLEATIAKLHAIGFSVRLATVMVKGMLDKPADIDDMIRFARANKVEQLTFRPVNQTAKPDKDNVKDKHIYDWTTVNRIPKDHVLILQEYVAAIGTPLMHLPHGATIYDVSGQNVCMTNSLTLSTNPDEIRQLIVFPDGKIAYDWQHVGARIL
jgi:molybdenum cofactor biosynthesis enzyme MoaA